MDILKARENINLIDDELVTLFEKRMILSAEIAEYKFENNLPIFNGEREREIIKKLSEKSDKNYSKYVEELYRKIFEISRSYQQEIIDKKGD